MIPYGRQSIDEDDIAAVVEVLRSPWLTTGPKVAEFEEAFAAQASVRQAVAVSSGTAALHCAMAALDIGPGDEVIVPPMTFAATANCVVYQGGVPIFGDVEPGTLLIDPDGLEQKITQKTKAIIAVDYAGQPCDYDRLREIATRHGLALVADACHAVGGSFRNRPVGALADMSTFSFHPVKNLTTGEGGMITTDDESLAKRMRRVRSHGVTADFRQRSEQASWHYDMVELGFNYRISDIQCALGLSQLKKLPVWLERRTAIAAQYAEAFSEEPDVTPLALKPDRVHGWHLYMIQLALDRMSSSRADVFRALRSSNIGANVHYIPVHLHPFYQERFGTGPGICPVAEAAYDSLITLPLFPGMSDADVRQVVTEVGKAVRGH